MYYIFVSFAFNNMELKIYDKSETQKDNLSVIIGGYRFSKSREHLLYEQFCEKCDYVGCLSGNIKSKVSLMYCNL